MYRFKLNTIEFNDGTKFSPGNITVFVGPNNAGKSRVLKDILSFVTVKNPKGIVVRKLECSLPAGVQELTDAYDVGYSQELGGAFSLRVLSPTLCSGNNLSVSGNRTWQDYAENMIRHISSRDFWPAFGPALITYLSTEHRLQLVKESKTSDGTSLNNLLQQFYRSEKKAELTVRKLVKQAFNTHEIALDFTSLQKMLIRVGKEFDSLPGDPRTARALLEASLKLDDQGDGIRAFVGIVVALNSLKRDVILVDEPETFLHPPQSFRIGELLADQPRQIIVATHSVDVLRGILSRKHQNVSVIRIDRTGDLNSFRILNPARLQQIVTDPLLSSARVLEGLFYKGSVVVEADSDARFYHMASIKMRPNVDLHFVNADNKQTVPRILEIYRELGIPSAGIVDIDVLSDAKEFHRQLAVVCKNEPEQKSARESRTIIASGLGEISPADRLAMIAANLQSALQSIPAEQPAPITETNTRLLIKQLESKLHETLEVGQPWREVKRRGVEALPTTMTIRNEFDSVLKMCAQNGLFINPAGELESMLRDSGIPVTTDKRSWIVQALQVLKDLQVDDTKLPWSFMKSVHDYLGASI